jgi:hypothetical protein
MTVRASIRSIAIRSKPKSSPGKRKRRARSWRTLPATACHYAATLAEPRTRMIDPGRLRWWARASLTLLNPTDDFYLDKLIWKILL